MDITSRIMPLVMTALLVVVTYSVSQEAPPENSIHAQVLKAADVSQKGVMMVVSERNTNTDNAKRLLSQQLSQNPGYQPLLIAPAAAELTHSLQVLALSRETLPAVIFFNKSGLEVGRVTSVAQYPDRLASASELM